jgi:malto-oligosyltrehalose trehalohydrolase
MERRDGGWFDLRTAEARPGSLYRFRIDGGIEVPDPASRSNPEDVHGPSRVVDPEAFEWGDAGWKGRAWEEAVLYELHVGAFSPEGNFAGVRQRLDHLVGLGVTGIELMPLAEFPGCRGWGYDGVLFYAPEGSYGSPEELKELVQAAHAKGVMVLLDVVYNHFGPEGNYLHLYASRFFTTRHHTPWGSALDLDGPASRTVRDFLIHNALYWLEEFHLDGLRFDSVGHLFDSSEPHLLKELAEAVHRGPGRDRHVHLILEHGLNEARYLERDEAGRPRWYAAQWNDDYHHVSHHLLTGEPGGYYADYADAPRRHLARCLSQGFAYQGERSGYWDGLPRGEASGHLPPAAFVNFLQNHDQVGNRALGERLHRLAEPRALKAFIGLTLLAPFPPLLFMGEEFGAATPFLFFCDFGPELAAAVRKGRAEFFERFHPVGASPLPDPNSAETFRRSVLDWGRMDGEWLGFYRELLALRAREITPRLKGMKGQQGAAHSQDTVLRMRWLLGDGSSLALAANLSEKDASGAGLPPGRLLRGSRLGPWSVVWVLEER